MLSQTVVLEVREANEHTLEMLTAALLPLSMEGRVFYQKRPNEFSKDISYGVASVYEEPVSAAKQTFWNADE